MSLRHEMLELSKAVRPKILKLARRRKLVDECFKEFQRKVYPRAPQDQVAEMRTCFYAGAAELFAMINYGTCFETDDATADDMEFMSGISDEIEGYYERVVATTKASGPAS